MNNWKRSNFIIDHESRNGKYYLFHTDSGNIIRIDSNKKKDLNNLLNNPNKASNKIALDHLINLGFVIPIDFDEYQVVTGKKMLNDLKNNYLELTILPTEKCNFRCVYCYENFEKPEMNDEIQKSIIEFVKKQLPKYKGLSISWFGGEPLLAVNVIEKLSLAFIDLCKKNKKPYRASITTNGYLLNLKLFDKLNNLRITHYQITVDGNRSIHDAQRILIDGKGSFDCIMNNLNEIKDHSKSKIWTMSLRTNVTQNIIANINSYKEEVIRPFSNDHRFYFMLRQMWSNNTIQADSILCDSDTFEDFVEKCDIGYESLYQEYTFAYGANFTCYASNPNSYVIGSDGALYKCTCALYDDINHIGKINLDGSLKIDNNKLSFWIAPRISQNSECMDCAQYAACVSRGCPYKQKQICNKNTLSNYKSYIPQFYNLAINKADLSNIM